MARRACSRIFATSRSSGRGGREGTQEARANEPLQRRPQWLATRTRLSMLPSRRPPAGPPTSLTTTPCANSADAQQCFLKAPCYSWTCWFRRPLPSRSTPIAAIRKLQNADLSEQPKAGGCVQPRDRRTHNENRPRRVQVREQGPGEDKAITT